MSDDFFAPNRNSSSGFTALSGRNPLRIRGQSARVGLISNGRTFDIRQFGAVGNGKTNDYSAFSRAMTRLQAVGGGDLIFPPGNFNMTNGGLGISTPTFTDSNGLPGVIRLRGSGRSVSTITVADVGQGLALGSSASVEDIAITADTGIALAANSTYCRIAGVAIKSYQSGGSGNILMYVQGSDHVMSDLLINGQTYGGVGIKFVGTSCTAQNISIINLNTVTPVAISIAGNKNSIFGLVATSFNNGTGLDMVGATDNLISFKADGGTGSKAFALDGSSTNNEILVTDLCPVASTGAVTTNNFIVQKGFVRAYAGIATLTVAGTPTDGSFTITPPNGTIAIDTTNLRIYVRISNLWKSVLVA